MLKRLKRKFITINMLLVAVVLIVVFTALCTSSFRSLKNDTMNALYRAADQSRDDMKPRMGQQGAPPPAQAQTGATQNADGQTVLTQTGDTQPALTQNADGQNVLTQTGAAPAEPAPAQAMPPQSDPPPDGGAPAGEQPGGPPGKSEQSGGFIPAFRVSFDEAGNIVDSTRDMVSISDEDFQTAVETALASNTREGYISGLDLRYLRDEAGGVISIAFADTTAEREGISRLIISCLAVGLGALGAFFAVSLFLAGWALRPVEQAWRQQRQFVADASHELKTPLTVILANTGVLLSHPDDSIRSQYRWAENTRDEAMRMKGLVEDMLTLAKAESGERIAAKTPVNLSELLWSVVLPYEPLAFERGVSITSDIAPELTVMGAESSLKQLCLILLDNACKYSGGGQVDVCLRKKGAAAQLSVHNGGAPIPAEDMPHLFERFYRVDKSRESSGGGCGLGLAIAKSICDAHGAQISAESGEGGTTFTVSFSG